MQQMVHIGMAQVQQMTILFQMPIIQLLKMVDMLGLVVFMKQTGNN